MEQFTDNVLLDLYPALADAVHEAQRRIGTSNGMLAKFSFDPACACEPCGKSQERWNGEKHVNTVLTETMDNLRVVLQATRDEINKRGLWSG